MDVFIKIKKNTIINFNIIDIDTIIILTDVNSQIVSTFEPLNNKFLDFLNQSTLKNFNTCNWSDHEDDYSGFDENEKKHFCDKCKGSFPEDQVGLFDFNLKFKDYKIKIIEIEEKLSANTTNKENKQNKPIPKECKELFEKIKLFYEKKMFNNYTFYKIIDGYYDYFVLNNNQ